MSLNQSRSDKSDPQFRKPGGSGGGRSGSSSGSHRGGRGRGGPGPTPSNPSNHRSYKKVNNAQGGQSRVNAGPANPSDRYTATGARPAENGGVQPALHGVTNTPAPAAIPKPADAPSHKTSRPLPKAPSSQSSSTNADSTQPSTPAKGDGATGFSLQFGSISPGFMNGMQVPPRTSSAPPNLDEQKRDQVRRDASRAMPAVPLPAAPKQDLSKKDAALPAKPVAQEMHLESKVKRDVQVASASHATPVQKPPTLPMTGMSMPLPFHQQPVPMQFGGPNPQIPSQGMQTSSLAMPMQMTLQMGNPSQVPQQVFVPGLQHPLLQAQGLIHQGQNLGYNPQLAPQLPHQLGNLGMNLPTQFNQQPSATLASTRKTVKITHPDTHEELRLDSRDGRSSGSRSHPSGPSQNQPHPAYTGAHPMGYYSNSYTSGSTFFPAQSSLPATSTQSNSSVQGPRFSYPVNLSASSTSSADKSGAAVHGVADPSSVVYARNQNKASPAQRISTPVTVKPALASNSSVTGKRDSSKPLNPVSESGVANKDVEVNLQSKSSIGRSNQSAPVAASTVAEVSNTASSTILPNISVKDATPILSSVDIVEKEITSKSTPVDDIQKQPSKKGNVQQSEQVDGESDSKVHQEGDTLKSSTSESAEAQKFDTTSALKEGVVEATELLPVVSDAASGKAAGSLSHSSGSCEAPDIVNEAVKDQQVRENDYSSRKKNSGEVAIMRDGVEEGSGVLQSDNYAKGSAAVKGTDQVLVLEKCSLLEDATEASQGEADSTPSVSGINNTQSEVSSFEHDSSTVSDGCSISESCTSKDVTDSVSCEQYDLQKSSMSGNEEMPVSSSTLEANAGHDKEAVDNPRPGSSSGSTSLANKAPIESNKAKFKGKKKWKEMLQKADALGDTADLYMAYKGPEEKRESVEATEVASEGSVTEVSGEAKPAESSGENVDESSKTEVDDWEDAAEISTPKLEPSVKDGGGSSVDEEAGTTKKYSRDFLLTFSEQCMDLPEGFEITSDVAGSIMRDSVGTPRNDREPPSPGRVIDRSAAARPDRRGNGMMSSERWNKQPGPFPPIQDPRMDLAYGGNVMGFSPGPGRGPNFGVLSRHPHGPGPAQIAGGILSGPMHHMGFQGLQRNSSDADRWLRGTNFNKGLMPAPHTPSPVMHKADRKYEVGKVDDEEQKKQRTLKGILNKLTPQNFEKLFEQVKEVNIDNVITLTGVISQIFDKALMEPTFCEMYADFCFHLSTELPDLSVDNEKITFRRLLLNKCQEEFERGEREEQEANNADGEGDTAQSEAQREEKRLQVRRRMLGNIRLIGELYKKRMLTERIMHECIKKLLGQYQNPDEENIEALCKLMSTIGEMIDHPKAKVLMDSYFDIMSQLSNNMRLSSRVRFMLKDSIDLRKNKWQQRRKVEGPKKIEDVHRDAAQERQGQVGRLSRGPSMNPGMRRGQPLDFGPRGSMLPTPMGAGGGFRGMPPQVRGFGGQDPRMDERNIFESRTLSVPLPQRSSADESITLGPQGGLARGMAFRGQPSVPGSPLLDNNPAYGDPRRMTVSGLNGYSAAASERGVYSSREDHLMRNTSDRFGTSAAYDPSSSQEFNASLPIREVRFPDRGFDRPRPTTPPVSRAGASPVQNNSTEKVLPEERLHDMSIAAIREYYSAKDVKEVTLCIKDMNAPSFHPTVVSIWVTDSFERKDMERDLLAKLLVNLTKPRDGAFNPTHLIQGFQSVLTNLEDTVTDAPKAPEFLGRIFGKVVLENVLPLKDVGRLIQLGGEEPGSLVEAGLAGEVLGSLLEMIQSEKGESTLNEIRSSSNLQIEDFRPPGSVRCRKLEMFM